ncbi:trans-sialidase, putative, partial [Trypanosoma cruzi marinkellei]
WVTDNNRTFSVGPLSVDSTENEALANTLLYSGGNLYIAQEKYMATHKGISLARLTEELNTIKFVLSSWAQLDALFSKSSVPTAGLVGFLSSATSDNTWIDEYRCVNATVTKAAKVAYGFKFTGPSSGATWPVNSREDDNHYGFVDYDFTLVATVTIHQAPNVSTSLLGAVLGDSKRTRFIGLSYSTGSEWETVFDGTKKAQKSTWKPGREHRVALVLQGTHKGISLARLTEELNTIKFVLSTWAQLDALFSKSSVPTAGLVGFLSSATSDNTWIDEYRCVNATVTKAAKVAYGFKFTGPSSGATWPVNSREDDNHYGFVDYDFTLVATVTIHQAPNVSTSLLGAVLGDSKRTRFIGLSYSTGSEWETVFDG